MDEQKTQTSAQPEHIPLLLIARELWRKLGLILMFAATAAACGYIAATLLYRPVYQTQTTFVVSVRNGSTVYANLNTASSMAETLSTFFEGDVMRKCITNDIGAASGTIKAKQIPETNLLTMTVSAPTQRDAHRITQSVLRNYNEQANKLLGDVALDVLCRPAVPVAPANSSGAVRIAKLSGLAGLFAAALYLAVRVYLRDTVKCEADVEQKLDTRLLATVRHEKKYKTLRAQLCLRKRKTSILITNPTTGFAFVETFKRLRTRVDYLMRRAQGRTILVTSLLEDEGKSTVAVNLALAMARRHKNVLLIDLDMKKPALYKLLDCQQEEFFPLETYLRGDAPVKKLVREDTRRGIYTILSRKGVGDTAQLLDSARLHDLLTQMHTRMDVIIIDTPPMSAGGDAECIADLADAAILVVRQDQAPVRALNDCIDVLRRSDAEVLGCVSYSITPMSRPSVTGRATVTVMAMATVMATVCRRRRSHERTQTREHRLGRRPAGAVCAQSPPPVVAVSGADRAVHGAVRRLCPPELPRAVYGLDNVSRQCRRHGAVRHQHGDRGTDGQDVSVYSHERSARQRRVRRHRPDGAARDLRDVGGGHEPVHAERDRHGCAAVL